MGNNSIIKKAIRGFTFALGAQIIALVLSVIRAIVLPKVMAVNDYGYWQLYVLYSGYVGMFALGYNDGIYLRYGKYQYEELPFRKLRSSMQFYIFMLLAFTILATVASFAFVESDKQIALFAAAVDIFFSGITGLFIFTLQITNLIKEYSFYTVLDKFILLFLILLMVLLHKLDYYLVIMADVFSRGVVAVALSVRCREYFIGSRDDLSTGFHEFSINIKSGINLMIANLMGMLVTGIGRFIVSSCGDIAEYAYYSFGITITNLVLLFVNALSLVLYPALKRLPEDNYGSYFEKLSLGVGFFNILSLLLYFPVVQFVCFFLPKYVPLIPYLHFLFGVVILQARMQIINNTYFKALREEKAMMRANMCCVIFFLVIAFASFRITRSIYAIALCTFISMYFMCYASECYLRNKVQLRIAKGTVFEMVSLALSMIVFSICDHAVSCIFYVIVICLYFVLFFPWHNVVPLLKEWRRKRKESK